MEHIAIDLGSKESQICIRGAGGEILEERRIATRPATLRHYLERRAPSRVIVEAGAEAFWVAELAQEAGHDARVAPSHSRPGPWSRRARTKERPSRRCSAECRLLPRRAALCAHPITSISCTAIAAGLTRRGGEGAHGPTERRAFAFAHYRGTRSFRGITDAGGESARPARRACRSAGNGLRVDRESQHHRCGDDQRLEDRGQARRARRSSAERPWRGTAGRDAIHRHRGSDRSF